MIKNIYTLVGIAASSKSTYANKLVQKRLMEDLEVPMPSNYINPTLVMNAEDIRKELYGDASIQGDGMEVFGILFDRYTQALKDNTTELIVIDNTSLTAKIRKRYYLLPNTICPMFNHVFNYNLVFFKPNLERSKLWNSMRDRKVPEDVIERQFNTYMGPSTKEYTYANIIEVDHDKEAI